MNWHLLEVDETLEFLGTSARGLNSSESEVRQKEYGKNQLEEKKKRHVVIQFLKQFTDFMVLILLAASVISGVVGDLTDTIVILAIVVLNAIVGFVQEYRAEKALEALKKMSALVSLVVREGESQWIPASELVPGDIVELDAGDLVPADLRLIQTFSLKVEEAALTGESHPVEKTSNILQAGQEEEIPLGDQINMAFKGTSIAYGRGTGVVVETGMRTMIGSIAKMLEGKETQTPLQKRLADFGKKLSFLVLGICILLFLGGLAQGEEPLQMLLTAIALAVAAIPEALPAVLTISLALGASRMARKNALVRKLPAVETLGSVTYICSDKTGTLTQNKMTVREVVYRNEDRVVSAKSGFDYLILAMALNNDSEKSSDGSWIGDPTEIALSEYAWGKDGFHSGYFARVAEIPFDSERKRMTTVHSIEGKNIAFVKGAVESVLDVCPSADRDEIEKKAIHLAKQGRRVLAYAYKEVGVIPDLPSQDELEEGLIYLGLVGMIDPPRLEAQEAVAECKQAGIVPVMITGDHPETAKAIASEVGIYDESTDLFFTGPELSKLKEEEYLDRVKRVKVYARVSPEQKLYIVSSLQSQGEYVAMTGDGVNDAPALKRSDIGIAMGITGTDVSKEASHMVLRDDNFATIVSAVKEGRRIFDNLRKFIQFAMMGNSGELWTIILSAVFALPIPLFPIHILWVNLVTDGLPGLALAVEPEEPNVMMRPPRKPEESLFAHGLGYRIFFFGLLIGFVCFGIQWVGLDRGMENWRTFVFTVLCMSQSFAALSIRSEKRSLFQLGLRSNYFMSGTILLNLGLQYALVSVPVLQKVFKTNHLSLEEFGICIVISLIPFVFMELEKLASRIFYPKA